MIHFRKYSSKNLTVVSECYQLVGGVVGVVLGSGSQKQTVHT
jgi:hypothetical protein